jgi:uncharacterized protein (DUF58 family)
MIVPTRRAVLLAAAGFPVALLPALVAAALWPLWAGALALSVAALVAEALLGRPPRDLAVHGRAPAVLYIGEENVLELELRATWGRRVEVEVVCDFDDLLATQAPRRAELAGTGASVVPIPLVPRRRGTAEVRAAWLRWRGPFGLLEWTKEHSLPVSLPVVPNVRAVRGAALRFFSSRQFLAGLKVERHLGDGSEFEALREHLPGLDSRAIDWKASARHHKMLSREYRAERNHSVVVAVDSGRLMAEPLLGVPKLDHAINASLLLAYVALKTGDRVGLFAFDDGVRLFTEPQGGVHAFPGLQRHAARVRYSQAETNFTLSLLELDRRLRRRSLVVVLTDFVDTVTAELMVDNLARLGRDHLVVFVALRDVSVDALVAAPPRDLDTLNRAMSAHDLVRDRDLVLGRLRRQGVHCVDAPPAAVSSRLINHYLEVKRRELV